MAKLSDNVNFGINYDTTATTPDYYYRIRSGFSVFDQSPKVVLAENDSSGFAGTNAVVAGNRFVDAGVIPMFLKIEHVYKTLASCLGRATPTAASVHPADKFQYTLTPDPDHTIHNYRIFYEDEDENSNPIIKAINGGTREIAIAFPTDTAITYEVTFDGETVSELTSPTSLTTAYLADSTYFTTSNVSKFSYTPSGGSEVDIKDLVFDATIRIVSGTELQNRLSGDRKRFGIGPIACEISFSSQRDNDVFSDLLASKNPAQFVLEITTGNFLFKMEMTGMQVTASSVTREFGSFVTDSGVTFVGTGSGSNPLLITLEIPNTLNIT